MNGIRWKKLWMPWKDKRKVSQRCWDEKDLPKRMDVFGRSFFVIKYLLLKGVDYSPATWRNSSFACSTVLISGTMT